MRAPRAAPLLLLGLLLLALQVPARAQSFPATYVGFLEGHCGEWIAELPGCWAFVDFQSPWKFFPDNDGRNAFAAFIPQGDVLLDSDSVIDDTGVVIPFLGVEVSTLALGGDAHLILATAGSLKVEGLGGFGGLITNDGRITLQGSAVLETPFAAQLLGSGDIVLDGESSVFRTLGVLSQADGHAIRGEGTVFASALLNEGAIVADRDEKALKITGALLTNDGLLRAGGLTPGLPGGELRLDPLRLVNSGDIVAEDGFIKVEDSDVENTGLIEARALGTIVLQDVDVEGGGGTFAVRNGGAFVLNGSNRIDGGTLAAEAGAEFAIGPGTTTLTGSVALQGLLATRGGTLRFDAVDLTMPDGTIEIGSGMLAQSFGVQSTFHGGAWRGDGVFDAFGATSWDATSGIHNQGLAINLHLANHRGAGTIRNDGTMSLVVDTGFRQTLSLLLDSDLAFEGDGTLRLRGTNGPVRIAAAVGGSRLRNGEDHLLRVEAGANATILANTTNEGRLEVRGANAFLTMPLADLRNAGLLGAFDGGVLTLRDTGTAAMLLHNTGGTIEAGAGSRIVLSDGHPATSHRTTIRGGTLAGASVFEAYRLVALDGATDGALTIASGGTVRAFWGSNLYLTGDILVDGRLDLADTTNFLSGPGTLWVEGATNIGGSGRTTFSVGNEMRLLGTSDAARLQVGADHTIAALSNTSGTMNVHTTNLGRIEARGANAFLTLPTAFIRNAGTIGAFDGGTLTIRDTGTGNALVDNAGGRIEAGAGSRVVLSESHPLVFQLTTVQGGALGGAGRFDALRFLLLDGATQGALTLEAGATLRAYSGVGLFLDGQIVNDGTIDLYDQTGHLSGIGTLWIAGDVRLDGTGQVQYGLGNEMRIKAADASARFAVGADQTIVALSNTSGSFDAHTTNRGRIEARGANAFLALPTAFVRNEGVLGAFEGGVLTLRDAGTAAMLLHNTGGVIEAGAGSRVVLSDGHPSVSHRTTIRGGTLAGDGRFDVARLVAFDGATSGALTIDAGATVLVGAGSNLFLAGAIVNEGTLDLSDTTNHTSGSGTLWIEGAVDLSGSGQTLFTRLNEMQIRGTDASAELRVGALQTISTVANAGVLGTISVAVRNEGHIEARGANAFLAMPTPFIRNTGVLGAYDGGTLTIRDTLTGNSVVNNLGGRIEAGAGGRVVLSESHPLVFQFTTVQGGTLGGAGRFDATRLLVLDGATQGALTIESGATVRAYSGVGLYLDGRIVNDGTIDLYDQTGFLSGAGTLWIVGDAQLDGTGRVQFGLGNEMRIAGASGDARMHVGAAQTVVALANTSGTANVDIHNAGVVEARGTSAFLTLDTDSVINRGRIGAEQGGTLRVGTPLGLTVIDNRGGELHAGAGSQLILQGATHPSHTAHTQVRGGEINGTGTLFANGRVAFTDGVVLSPGNSPGVLTVEGNLALDPLGALEIEILGPTLGSEYDQLLVRGQLSMDGMLDLLFPSTFRPRSTDVFTVLSATQLLGGFDNVRDGRIEFRFGAFDVLADRNSLRLTNFVAAVDPVGVPAPPASTLLFAGVLAVLGMRALLGRAAREGARSGRGAAR